MMARRWHVEHADGRRWTFGELAEIPIEIDGEGAVAIGVGEVLGLSPVLLCDGNRYVFAGDVTGDMEVVWDG